MAWWPDKVRDLDAVVTSPPFFDSTRFHVQNWMRLWFCGWEARDFVTQPRAFIDERQKGSFAVYEHVLRQARERLKPGGVVALHLGVSRKKDMARAMADIAQPWFRVLDVFEEDVRHLESHGVRDERNGSRALIPNPRLGAGFAACRTTIIGLAASTDITHLIGSDRTREELRSCRGSGSIDSRRSDQFDSVRDCTRQFRVHGRERRTE